VDDAVAFAERVRRAVEERAFTYEGGTLHRTLSAGVAAWPHPDVRHQEALVKAADDALYLAKAQGRNKVVAYGGQEFLEASPGETAADGAAR
jgi:diguanylate cyclase (GGDEF)-like protein